MDFQGMLWLAVLIFVLLAVVVVVQWIRRPLPGDRSKHPILDDASAFPVNDAELYQNENLDKEPLVEVFTAFNEWDAEQAAEVLSQNGIRCHKSNTALQNAVGDLPYYAIAPRLLVLERDAARSCELLEKAKQENSSSLAGPVWQCSECGNENDPGFHVCWSCQAPHEEARTNPL